MFDPAVHLLGRAKAKRYAKTFKLEDLLHHKAVPAYKPTCTWSAAVADWGMMLNDTIGDCTIAGRGHHHLLRTTLAGTPDRPTDAQVQADYIAVTGIEGAAYDPVTGDNDNGCALEDVLNYFRKAGQIGAFVSFNPLNVDHFKFVIEAFEGAYCGIGLPISAQGQTKWTVTDPSLQGDAAPGSWGGHCIIVPDYDDKGGYGAGTWGMIQPFDQDWWNEYANPHTAADGEAYAVISNEMVAGTKPVPSGFDLAQLQALLAAL